MSTASRRPDRARGRVDPARIRRWRDCGRWRRTRAGYLARHPLCAACEAKGLIVGAEELDHIRPVSAGGEFWSPDNWQGLCGPCHIEKTAAEQSKRPPICAHGYGPGECRRCGPVSEERLGQPLPG